MFKNKEEHPSYGMLSFKRTTNAKEKELFGSSIKHNDTIRMVLKSASVARELNQEWYFGDNVIAEVEMSYSQFAEVITSMNMGDGVPVTIRFTEKQGYIEEPSFTPKGEQFQKEFAEHLECITKEIDETVLKIRDIFAEKQSIGKKDREDILKMLESIRGNVNNNTTFIYEQFNEQMDKTVVEAKGEIEAFYQNKIMSMVQAKLVENNEELVKLENLSKL